MNVSMIDCLPGRCAVINADREAIRLDLRVQLCTNRSNELPHGYEFIGQQIKDALYVAPWDHKRVVRRDGVAITDGEGMLIFRGYLIRKQAAERTCWIPNYCGVLVVCHSMSQRLAWCPRRFVAASKAV